MLENERIEKIRKALNLNKKSFAEVLGYSTPQSYTNYINRNRSVSIKMLRALTAYNDEINIHWILTGKGEMFIDPDGNSRNSSTDNVELLKKEIQHLNEKLKDKEEIIRLMKNQS